MTRKGTDQVNGNGVGGEGNDNGWMPPRSEWDFRTIRERESRLACCWEYARSVSVIRNNLAEWLGARAA
jgi:hypothetical protein